MSKVFTIPVTLEGANRTKDRSISLRFNSLFEVNNDDFAHLDTMYQSMGYLLFSERELNEKDIPDEDIKDTDLKTPSQRLRNILYVYHMEKDGEPAKFRQFYEITMEKYIDKIKQQLDL